MKGNRMEAELVFRALGDARRIQILDMLMEKEMNAGEILERVDVVQSTLSHHMKSLCDSGLVASRRDGKWTYYAVQSGTVREAAKFLERFFAPAAAKDTEETGEAAPAAPAPAAPVRAAKAEKPAKEVKPEKPAKEAKAEKPVKEEKAEKPEKKKQSGSLGEDIFDEPAPAAESTAKKSGRKADKADKAGKAGKADKKAGRDEGKKKPKEEDDARESVYASMKEKTKKKKADKQGKAEKKKGSKKAGKK